MASQQERQCDGCVSSSQNSPHQVLHRARVLVLSVAVFGMTVNVCDDVDNGLDNTCEVIRQETVLFSTPETDYIIYD